MVKENKKNLLDKFINGDVQGLNIVAFNNYLYISVLINEITSGDPKIIASVEQQNKQFVQTGNMIGTQLYLIVVDNSGKAIINVSLIAFFSSRVDLSSGNTQFPNFQLQFSESGDMVASLSTTSRSVQLNNRQVLGNTLPPYPLPQRNVNFISSSYQILLYFGNILSDCFEINCDSRFTVLRWFTFNSYIAPGPLNFTILDGKAYFVSNYRRVLQGFNIFEKETFSSDADLNNPQSVLYYGYWDYTFDNVTLKIARIIGNGNGLISSQIITLNRPLVNIFDGGSVKESVCDHDPNADTIVFTFIAAGQLELSDGIIVGSDANNNTTLGIVQVTPSLEFLGLKSVGPADPKFENEINNNNIIKDASGNLYLSGRLNGDYCFGDILVTSPRDGFSEQYLAKLGTEFEWVHKINPNIPSNTINMIYLANRGNNIVVGSHFWLKADLSGIVIEGGGSSDLYLAETTPAGRFTTISKILCNTGVQESLLLTQTTGNFYLSSSFYNAGLVSLSVIIV